MEFKPYKINESLENSYYQLPVELFQNPIYMEKLSLESKVLYGFLLSRMRLSAQNGWIDENGSIFLIFKRADVQKKLNLSDKTVTKAFKQLNEVKLIYEKTQGRNKPNLIYIGQIEHMPLHEELTRKKYDSGVVKNTSPDPENLRPIYIDKYKENINNNPSSLKINNKFIDDSGQYENLDKYIENFKED